METESQVFSESDVLKAFSAQGIAVVKMPQEITVGVVDTSGLDAEHPKFTDMMQKRIADFAKICGQYLSGSVLTDQFKDHSERREWRIKMSRKFGKSFTRLSESNKLRINNIGGVMGHFAALTSGFDAFKIHSPKAESIRALESQFPDVSAYDELSVQGKLQVVEKMDRICNRFLEIVSEK